MEFFRLTLESISRIFNFVQNKHHHRRELEKTPHMHLDGLFLKLNIVFIMHNQHSTRTRYIRCCTTALDFRPFPRISVYSS